MILIRRSLKALKVLVAIKNNALKKYFCTIPNYEVNLKVNGISLNNYIKKLQEEFEIIKSSGENNKRRLELQPIIQLLNDRKVLADNIYGLNSLLKEKDNDIRNLAQDEQCIYKKQLEKLDQLLLKSLLPTEKEDLYSSIVLEVQAGVGGQEAMLFAREIFEMYCNFVVYKGWSYELMDHVVTDLGGMRFASALISGHSVNRYFKHEVGVHRVQRIPATEKGGRVHTSTISVIVLPQPYDIEVNIHSSDMKIETKRSSGPGGQHVNKTESAVRIVHLPTGIAVECQVDRSQIKNKKLAIAKLNALLYERETTLQNSQIESTKKSQVKTRNRNEKIRTYNFSQDRITDHRLGVNVHNLKVFLEGREPLDTLIEKLDDHYATEHLLDIVKSVN